MSTALALGLLHAALRNPGPPPFASGLGCFTFWGLYYSNKYREAENEIFWFFENGIF